MRYVPVALGLALVAGCNFSAGKSVDKSDVEHQVAARLAAQVGRQPKRMVCPGNLKANDGTKYGVTVTVASVKDDKVKYNIKVDDKPLSGD